jgi:hypothetical protein
MSEEPLNDEECKLALIMILDTWPVYKPDPQLQDSPYPQGLTIIIKKKEKL